MKRVAMVVSVLVLLLAVSTICVYAEQAAPAGMTGDESNAAMMCGKMMQGHSMSDYTDMMSAGKMTMEGDRMMGHINMMMENPMGGRHMAMRVMMMLNFDEKQHSAGQEILDRMTKEMIRMKANLEIAEMDLEMIVHMDPIDMTAAEGKIKQIESIKADMFLTHLKAFKEF